MDEPLKKEEPLYRVNPLAKEVRPWEVKAREYSSCPILNQNLYRIAYTLTGRNDADYVQVISGIEGSGKTNLGIYCCKTVDEALGREFDVTKQIYYGSAHLLKYIESITEPQAILVDESENALFSRDWNKEGNGNFVKALMQVRIKHLYLCLIIPDFRMIDTYVRNHRVDALLVPEMYYSHKSGNYVRGPFKCYNRKKIKRIRVFREGGIQYPSPNFWEVTPDLHDTEMWKQYKETETPRKNEAFARFSSTDAGLSQKQLREERKRKPKYQVYGVPD